MLKSITTVAFDQHAATTVGAVLLPGHRTPALHSLTSDDQRPARPVSRSFLTICETSDDDGDVHKLRTEHGASRRPDDTTPSTTVGQKVHLQRLQVRTGLSSERPISARFTDRSEVGRGNRIASLVVPRGAVHD